MQEASEGDTIATVKLLCMQITVKHLLWGARQAQAGVMKHAMLLGSPENSASGVVMADML
jgi:hypothetical protein